MWTLLSIHEYLICHMSYRFLKNKPIIIFHYDFGCFFNLFLPTILVKRMNLFLFLNSPLMRVSSIPTRTWWPLHSTQPHRLHHFSCHVTAFRWPSLQQVPRWVSKTHISSTWGNWHRVLRIASLTRSVATYCMSGIQVTQRDGNNFKLQTESITLCQWPGLWQTLYVTDPVCDRHSMSMTRSVTDTLCHWPGLWLYVCDPMCQHKPEWLSTFEVLVVYLWRGSIFGVISDSIHSLSVILIVVLTQHDKPD